MNGLRLLKLTLNGDVDEEGVVVDVLVLVVCVTGGGSGSSSIRIAWSLLNKSVNFIILQYCFDCDCSCGCDRAVFRLFQVVSGQAYSRSHTFSRLKCIAVYCKYIAYCLPHFPYFPFFLLVAPLRHHRILKAGS